MKRLYYLDTLKVMLTILVVFHHAAEAYSPYSAWVYKPSNKEEMMPLIWHFNSVNAAFFMGLFFFIAGYFVPRSYDKQGIWVFVKKKLLRLGIPVVLVTAFLIYATGHLEVGHLWYVESLLLFCLVYALVRKFVSPIQVKSYISLVELLAVALVMGVGGYFIRQVSPQDNWIWLLGFIHIEPAHYLQYVIMFILGVLAYRGQWLTGMNNRTGAISLLIGSALAIGDYVRNDGAWNNFVCQWFGIYESLLCVFFSVGLLWLFREFVNGTNAAQPTNPVGEGLAR
jgi:fucose 4-O-acetylase-like acetyltransferase